ncbi:MAG: hypothetical protein AAFV53_19540 [Myxococcota bacterium]
MTLLLYWLGAAQGTEALPDDAARDDERLIVELTDLDAARGVELICPDGHRDAARFVFGRAVLTTPEDGCTLRFIGPQGAVVEPAGPGELMCAVGDGLAECFSTCTVASPR